MTPASLADEPLIDKVVEHKKSQSRVRLHSDHNNENWGITIRPKKPLNVEDLEYKDIPRCKESGVRRKRLGTLIHAAEIFDVVYYHREDSPPPLSQLFAVAYSPRLPVDRTDGKPLYWQNFARVANIRCLPTRFRMYRGSDGNFIEYREGESAWK